MNPGDPDYNRHLPEWNRRNNIPDDIIPPASQSPAEDEVHPPSYQSDPPSDHENDDYNINQNDNNNNFLSIEEMEEQAAIAYVRMTRKVDLDKGLSILYSQKGNQILSIQY